MVNLVIQPDGVTLPSLIALTVRDSASTAPEQPSVSAASSPVAPDAVTVTLSRNAQRLQTAAANLSADEASKTNGELSAEWNRDLASSVDIRTEFAADAEISALPASDSDHVAQAKAAQTYVKARVISGGDPSKYGTNPFAGMSQTSLAAIANDKAGLYTSYEKSAALYESTEQTNAWVMRHANDPQGQGAGFYQEAIDQYAKLSLLQQSVYPAGYTQNLEVEKARDSGLKETDSISKESDLNVKKKSRVQSLPTRSAKAKRKRAALTSAKRTNLVKTTV